MIGFVIFLVFAGSIWTRTHRQKKNAAKEHLGLGYRIVQSATAALAVITIIFIITHW